VYRAQFYAERFLHYMGDVLPPGEAPSIHPFVPCQVTTMEQNIPLLVTGIREIAANFVSAPSDLSNESYSEIHKHNVASSTFSNDVKFVVKEYMPQVFAKLRTLWGISDEEFAAEWDVPYLQIQATSTMIVDDNGRTTTYLPSTNKRLLFETIQQKDAHEVTTLLLHYTPYVHKHPDTLLSKYVGLFKCTINILNKIYIIVSLNPEYCGTQINYYAYRMYSLQGIQTGHHPITQSRDEMGAYLQPTIYYDKNLDRNFELGAQRAALMELMKRDVEFLRSNSIILYNLVVYVGKVMPAEGVDVGQITSLKRGLVKSSFGEWVLLGGIQTLWKRFDFITSVTSFSKSILLLRRQETSPVTSPDLYAGRFLQAMNDTFIQ
jgi:hypothetical protein